MANGQITLLDVVKETVHLARVRKTCLLVVLSTYILAILASHGLGDYFSYMSRRTVPVSSKESEEACFKTIIVPWMIADSIKNLSASQQEEFYRSYKLNCTMFEDSPKIWGTYKFNNGSLSYSFTSSLASAQSTKTYNYASTILYLLVQMWKLWGPVAFAWALQGATTTTPSYNSRPPVHRDPIYPMGSQNLAELLREQFSGRVFRGVIRAGLTKTVVTTLYLTTDLLGAKVRALLANRIVNPKVLHIMTVWVSLNPAIRALANPLPLLFLFWWVAAALESGMWGFKALRRGIRLTRGNRWKSFFVYLLLVPWTGLCIYLRDAVTLHPAEQLKESLSGLLRRWMTRGILTGAMRVPEFLLVPVFYFFCKSWCEKLAMMA